MSSSAKKVKKAVLRRLSVFSGIGLSGIDRQTSWPAVSPSSSRFDQWRYEQPVDITNPLAIRRTLDRRVTFDSVWHSRHKTEDDFAEITDDADANKKTERKTRCSEFSLLTSSISENDTHNHSYVNTIFKNAELNHNDVFVSAFGKKGTNAGDYQDAKHITCFSNGELLITDLINDRLQICSNVTSSVTIFSPDEIKQPWATAVTTDGNIAVTSCKERCVKLFNIKGEFIDEFGQKYFVRPTGLAVDNYGNFIVCDSVIDKVSMFDKNGTFIRFLGNSFIQEECFNSPRYVCVSITGEIIVSDCGHHKIKVFDSDGNFIRSFGSFGNGDRQLKCPYGVSTNKYGDIFVSDHYNSRISMFSREGVFIRHVVTSEHGLVHPQGLTISHDLYMYISHGHLKANEILVYKLSDALDYEYSNIIHYV
ncbi:tripartite motif-containing protein 3-like [Mercenaria mercenaria]|uniref:tripartite motif-containing protein 3-like n=1 Tax=Mercenaria mercenaria TaxID=6596 RepID=UPI00234E6865|nr:tripartite motif-containing protein 3-like [Mercenaria mercenaria]